jgi:hypothetical protein
VVVLLLIMQAQELAALAILLQPLHLRGMLAVTVLELLGLVLVRLVVEAELLLLEEMLVHPRHLMLVPVVMERHH